ncbi:MAG: ATP-binding protein [Planctomycetaceae bacterium]
MKLTLKMILVFLVAACGLVGVSGYLAVQREVDFINSQTSQGHLKLARAIEPYFRSWDSRQFLQVQQRLKGEILVRRVSFHSNASDDQRPLAAADVGSKLSLDTAVSVIVRGSEFGDLFCSYYQFDNIPGVADVLELSEPLSNRDEYTRDTLLRTAVLMASLFGAAVILVTYFGVELVGRRLDALIEKTRSATDGDLLTPVEVGGNDELTELGTALNQMCQKLDASQRAVLRESSQRISAMEQLRHADRLKTVGRLASGVAHELGTPLNVVSGRAGLIVSGKLSPEETTQSAKTIQAESARMTGIVQQLLNFARRNTPRRNRCNLRVLVEETSRLLEPLAHKRNAVVAITDAADSPPVWLQADGGQLQQVFSNLIMNAVMSKNHGANVSVSMDVVEAEPSDDLSPTRRNCVRVTVSDDGEGIDAEALPHLFEPFFTTRDVGEGTGLGLSIAHGIVAEHGGWITVESAPNQGSSFRVYLPMDAAAAGEP